MSISDTEDAVVSQRPPPGDFTSEYDALYLLTLWAPAMPLLPASLFPVLNLLLLARSNSIAISGRFPSSASNTYVFTFLGPYTSALNMSCSLSNTIHTTAIVASVSSAFATPERGTRLSVFNLSKKDAKRRRRGLALPNSPTERAQSLEAQLMDGTVFAVLSKIGGLVVGSPGRKPSTL